MFRQVNKMHYGLPLAFTCLCLLSLLLTFSSNAAAQSHDNRIYAFESRHANDRTRLVFEMDTVPAYTYDYQQGGRLLTLTFESTRLATRLPTRFIKASLVKSVTRKQAKPYVSVTEGAPAEGSSHLVLSFELADAAKPSFTALPPVGDYRHRLLLDFTGPSVLQKSLRAPRKSESSDIIVVVDAGHGGHDPGAVAYGQEEKDITLAIANYIVDEFDKISGIHCIMTRSQDVFVGLSERVRIARALKADFFVSIHADAYIHPRAAGASVYIRSDKSGASSAAAAWLATQANNSAISIADNLVHDVLAGMSAQASMATALDYGDVLLSSLGSVTRLHSNRVERGDFTVLSAPDIPSILVETGFISNPAEANLLRSDSHKKKLARQIASALATFIRQQPPSATWALSKPPESVPYIVASGDTLSEIAKAFDVSPSSIVRHNGLLDANAIRVGDVLLVP